jgi:hypothetical protein
MEVKMFELDEKQTTKDKIEINELLKKPYLSEKEVAALTGRSVFTLRNERHLRRGIPYLKISARSIRYMLQDVQAAMEARRITF